MKIGLLSIPEIPTGKHNIKDPRLDQVHKLSQAKKETYVQVEIIGEGALLEADVILVFRDARSDLILKDLEFVESRLSRSDNEEEKILLGKLKVILEKEEFVFNLQLSLDEKEKISGYGLLTDKPIMVLQREALENLDSLLMKVLKESGFISFFTTGEKETRAWLVPGGTTAYDASGEVHSDIQKGFIRAEVIGFDDFIQAGGQTQAKQAGKMHLEQKDYVLQDADIVNFRFNK